MYKIEIVVGWNSEEKITIDTMDFDKIEVLKEFIEFQEKEGWGGAWEAIDFDDEEDEEDEDDEDESVIQ